MAFTIKNLFPLIMFFSCSSSAPTKSKTDIDEQTRHAKSLSYFDFYQPEELDFSNYDTETEDYVPIDVEENELSRTIPSKKRYNPPQAQFNSPIYYIRMPPQPYMFVPGLGYVSQPAPHPMGQFLNVPVSFVANGKPSTIYQWSGGMDRFPGVSEPIPTMPPKPKPQPPKPTDSSMHRLPGQYVFNGKPEDIYVLRDSYNSLYNDALQNFYP